MKVELKSSYPNSFLPKNVNYTNYSMLVAIANYSNNAICKHQANVLVSETESLDVKNRVSKSLGGFMYDVCFGKFGKVYQKADNGNRKALIEALQNNEIDFVSE